ncbi:MAG: neutral/alkaline non-lysosomal ceramidase N-terminal domain-containing protein [Candidatus Omnitrophica bacterium]|nr:neutral/alkaline non-lysosomal ceramidase N-terminal domain-containing protein [Candidatus Omnitrophota bacterium]
MCGERLRFLVAWLFLAAACCPDAQAKGAVLAGAAKLQLIPPVSVPLAGYSRRHGKRSTGVHDPLFVRAVVLQDADTTVALVSCDLLIIDEALFEAVRRKVEPAFHGRPFTLLLAATHTHSGPGAYGRKFLEKLSMGHFDPRVLDFLAGRIAEAVAAAASDLQPADLRYATGSAMGLTVNRMDANGPVDAELTVVSFETPARRPLAILVNFAAHPTTLGAWNMALSADYPGVVARELEARHPGAVSLFLAGAAGDQAPVKRGEGAAPAEWLGGELAREALTLLDAAPRESLTAVVAEQRLMPLAPAQLRLGWLSLPSWLGQSLVDDDATLTVVGIGPVVFFGVPCDLTAELGFAVKRAARQQERHPVIVGFANDYIGYCLSEQAYRARSYEASMAFNGPRTGEQIVEGLVRMLDGLVSE